MDGIPFDLTNSNPTSCEFPYPTDLLGPLSHERGLVHEPDPRGHLSTRAAVALEYQKWRIEVDPDHVFLTASTSEAYGFLFRLLADPGETVLVPAPSYPLFDQLARLDGIRVQSYSLDPDTGWRIDFSMLENARDTVRAIVVVHPNNPTGSFVHPEDSQRLVRLCADRGWALIADEVFLSFVLGGGPGEGNSFAGTDECLCFSLGGLSKSLGLPQLKLAWIVVSGPVETVRQAVEGLEFIADAYLSVSTPISLAAPELLAEGGMLRKAIMQRCCANLEALRTRAEDFPFSNVPEVGGGWSAVLRVPAVTDDEELCVRLLEDFGVAVHPGYLFQFPRDGHLVISLLPTLARFCEGAERLFEGLETLVNSPHPENPRIPNVSV
jgi:hypothetical protein